MIREIQREIGSSVLFVTHDMGVHANLDRPARHHVCGPAGRGGPHRPRSSAIRASLHRASHRQPAAHRRRRAEAGAGRRAAQPRRSAAGLPLPSALPAGDGDLPARGAAHAARSRPGIASPASPSTQEQPSMSEPLLDVCQRQQDLHQRRPVVAAADRGRRRRQLPLDARRPEIFAIIGESGSGKTTLARMILNIVTPTSGTIRFRGLDLATHPRRREPHGLHAPGAADLPEPVRGLQSAEAARPLSVHDARAASSDAQQDDAGDGWPTRRCARSACRWPR